MAVIQFYGEKHPYNFFLPPAQARQFAVLPVSFPCFSPALARAAGAGRRADSDKKGPKSKSKTQPRQVALQAGNRRRGKPLEKPWAGDPGLWAPGQALPGTQDPHLGLIEVFHTHTIHGGSQVPWAIRLQGGEETQPGYQQGGMQFPQSF